MSGGFITTYRAEDVEKLKVRMKNGVGSFKFKPFEYERLQEVLEAKRLESEIIGQKVQRTRCAAKATKQRSLLQQHRQVWSRECQRLQKAEEKAENDFLDFLEQIRPNSVTDSAIFSLPEYELFLARERESFRTATVHPVHQIRDDLQFRLVEIQQQKVSTMSSDWNPVMHQNEHNRIWDSQRFTQAQLRAVTQQCQRDQEELWVKALVTIQEAKHAHQQKLEVYRDRQHQQDICLKLREKLQQWRAQQEEVAKLEAAIAAREHQQKEARLKRGQEKEAAFRSQQTKEVRMFHLKEQKRREELQQRDELRLAKLRSLMEEQARRDKQRVQFRADMLEQRRMQRDAQEAERQREEKAREERLEALRNKVAVVAEADPERLMAETKAWRNQLSAKETELPRPLYNINTYTDTQIVSDPRMRVEQALREAGVQHSQYAREVLSIVKPVKPPRRDTKSLLQF
uniref:Coiled-coil domain-containing protein 148 n=1 Tax=Gouania willdenowi TaxID=441366 RepID=A0A8C5NFS0_GOUWI